MIACNSEEWNRFVEKALIFTGDSNVNADFSKLTKQFGRAYINYLGAAYEARDHMDDKTFCEINGNVPIGFLTKLK